MKELIDALKRTTDIASKNSEHIGKILDLMQDVIGRLKVLEERLNNEDIRS